MGKMKWILLMLAIIIVGFLVLHGIGPSAPPSPSGTPSATNTESSQVATRPTPTPPTPTPTPKPVASGPIQYLLFQSFYGAGFDAVSGMSSDNSELRGAPTPWNQATLKAGLESYVTKIQDKLQPATFTKAAAREYGFSTGPLTLDQTDKDLEDSIKTAFDVALEKKVAVALHFDVTHFWKYAKNADGTLLAASRGAGDNREWKDWRGTIADPDAWDGVPGLMPSMCFECTQVKALVDHEAADVIAPAIKAGLDRLQAAGEQDLFAGVIVGWEAGPVNSTGLVVGYHSLSIKGYSSTAPPTDLKNAQHQVVHDYLLRWTKTLAEGGVPKEKIYTHDSVSGPDSLWEAFNDYSNAGFSIYINSAHDGLFNAIWAEAGKHSSSWGEPEGTNATIAGKPSAISWETYLGSIFNHGGTLANIFAGFLPQPADGYTTSTESAEAVAAYQKFLSGGTLQE